MKINKFLQFKSIVITTLLLLLITQSFISVVTFAASDSIRNSPLVRLDEKSKNQKNRGNYIIKFKNEVSEEAKSDYLMKNSIGKDSIKNGEVKFDRVVTNNLNNKLDPSIVDLVEEDGAIEAQAVEYNDPEYANQWYLKAINFEQSEITTGDEKIVAVIDSGVCASHPDLQGKILEGWNFVDDTSDTNDTNGHGCAVSGAIAASSNNSIGIVGIASNVKILPLKVIGNDDVGSYSDLMSAIDYAVSKKVDIINISLGGYFDSQILHEVIQDATNAGIQVVASAGNTGNSEIMYPAKFDEVISVGSVENDYTVSDFSTNSTDIDLWTYGSHILTTNKDNSYSSMQGTSISAGIVSGFLAKGGMYERGMITNFISKSIKPIFKNNLIEIVEPVSGLKFQVPENLNIEGFENANPQSYVINWQKVIKVANGESMVISIWNRESESDLKKVYKIIKEQDGCKESKDICLLNFPSKEGHNSGYSKYFVKGKTLVRVMYTFHSQVGFNIFESYSRTLSLNNHKLFNDKDYESLNNGLIENIVIPQGATYCGGLYDTNNPYDCCDDVNQGQNDANCTWYAAYKRPDLKGTITLWPGGLFTQAQQAGFPTSSNQPSSGALIVWEYHVAYVESYNSTSVTWSEQNCYNTNNAYNASVTRNSYTPDYAAGSFKGYIYYKNDCNGTNPVMSNWNSNGPQTCNPTSSLKIQPESHLTGNNGTITITVH